MKLYSSFAANYLPNTSDSHQYTSLVFESIKSIREAFETRPSVREADPDSENCFSTPGKLAPGGELLFMSALGQPKFLAVSCLPVLRNVDRPLWIAGLM